MFREFRKFLQLLQFKFAGAWKAKYSDLQKSRKCCRREHHCLQRVRICLSWTPASNRRLLCCKANNVGGFSSCVIIMAKTSANDKLINFYTVVSILSIHWSLFLCHPNLRLRPFLIPDMNGGISWLFLAFPRWLVSSSSNTVSIYSQVRPHVRTLMWTTLTWRPVIYSTSHISYSHRYIGVEQNLLFKNSIGLATVDSDYYIIWLATTLCK